MEGIPPELLNTNLKDIQLNVTTMVLAAMLLGRAYKGALKHGGIKGIFRGLIFGENAPEKDKQ
jgi:hypothetical protein